MSQTKRTHLVHCLKSKRTIPSLHSVHWPFLLQPLKAFHHCPHHITPEVECLNLKLKHLLLPLDHQKLIETKKYVPFKNSQRIHVPSMMLLRCMLWWRKERQLSGNSSSTKKKKGNWTESLLLTHIILGCNQQPRAYWGMWGSRMAAGKEVKGIREIFSKGCKREREYCVMCNSGLNSVIFRSTLHKE